MTPGGCTLSSCKYDGISNPNFLYDADGNIHCVTTKTACDGYAARTYGFTSFDMAETIAQGASTTSIGYSPEHQRGSLTTSAGTLYYFSNPAAGVLEELAPGGTQWRTYLAPWGHIVAEMFTTGGTTTPYYFVGDHLSSTAALTDQNGNPVETDSYDAWGNRRKVSGNDNPTGCALNPNPPSKSTRGFTSQEELDALCLVNLNARLYDPTIGRMLSADSMVPNSFDGQSFNRYSYVENGPLSAIDPSGHDCDGDHPNCYAHPYNGMDGMPCWGCSGQGWDDGQPVGLGNYTIDAGGHLYGCNSDACLQSLLDGIVAANDATDTETAVAQIYGGVLYGVTVENPNASPGDPLAFVGGLGDSTGGEGSVQRQEAIFEALNPGVNASFFAWNQGDQLQAWFDALSNNVDVTLIGQSLGGTTAADAAIANPGVVDTLITVDPVTLGDVSAQLANGTYFQQIRESVGTWVDATQSPLRLGLFAGLGIATPWGTGPDEYATHFVQTDFQHGDFVDVMRTLDTDGYLPEGLDWLQFGQ